MAALADAYGILKHGTLWSSTGRCKGYAVSNPGEAATIDAYVAALDAGQRPTPPVLATDTGRGIVGMLAALAPTPSPGVLFYEDFTAGLDPAKWWVGSGGMGDSIFSQSPADPANVFVDGSGDLVLRARRTSIGYTGAFCGTFAYATGWPPSPIKASWPVPFRYEARARMPNSPGLWDCFGWLQNVDRTTGENIYELDVGEMRLGQATVYGTNQHTWLAGADRNAHNHGYAGPDASGGFHLMAAEVRSDRVDYFLDGALIDTAYGVSGRLGLLLQNIVAPPGSWGSNGQQPAASDPGPWDMVVDYVRVTALT